MLSHPERSKPEFLREPSIRGKVLAAPLPQERSEFHLFHTLKVPYLAGRGFIGGCLVSVMLFLAC